MTKPRTETPNESDRTPPQGGASGESPANQPAPTGGNAGSPAAPAMKQFQKTKTESGRS